MKETLSSIASRLGVSIATVSRVLSGNAENYRISEATRDRILEEAKRCGYIQSMVAQSLRKNKTSTIGLLLPSVSNPYFAEMTSVIISDLYKRGYSTIVIDTMDDEKIFEDSLPLLVSRQVDGMIVVPCGTDSSLLESVDRDYCPVVLIDRFYESTRLSYVTTNNYKGGFDATNMLIGKGHRQIACIQGVESSMPNIERVRGYCAAMSAAGYEDDILIVGNAFSIQNGYLETKLLLNHPQPPSAIFALGNTIALGAMKAIRETNLSIPENLSLVSFDNNIYMDYMEPAITRISQPVEDMATLATKILFDRIVAKSHVSSQLRLSPSIVMAGSVALPQSSIAPAQG